MMEQASKCVYQTRDSSTKDLLVKLEKQIKD